MGTSRWGVVLLCVGVSGHLVSALARIDSGSAFTLLPVLVGLVLVLAGREVLGHAAFPIAFLVFMIPLPMQLIADLNLELKMVATRAAEGILDYLGV